MLANYLIQFNGAHPADEKVLIIAHSQGAAITRNGLALCDPAVRDRAIVVTLGPAAIVSGELCKKADNYISTADPVGCYSDKAGIAAYRSDVHFKTPHPKASKRFDHGFASPTYAGPIKDHVTDHINRHRRRSS